jgi:hypothetical protein
MTETVKNRIMILGPKAAGGKAARADGRSWGACRAGLGVARLCDAPGRVVASVPDTRPSKPLAAVRFTQSGRNPR